MHRGLWITAIGAVFERMGMARKRSIFHDSAFPKFSLCHSDDAQRRNLLFADSLTRLFGKTDSSRKNRALIA
jgi:hypothetical protein